MSQDIMMVVMDSVRFDRIFGDNAVYTPNIDSLAEDSIQFNQAYTTGSWTVPAHGSLFTGDLPSSHSSYAGNERFNVNTEETLAGKLSQQGYRTIGFSTNPWLTKEFGYNAGFHEFVEIMPNPPFPEAGNPSEIDSDGSGSDYWREILDWLRDGPTLKRFVNGVSEKFRDTHPSCSAEVVNERIDEWVSKYDPEESVFSFVNYMDAHEPYRIRPQYIESQDHQPLEKLNLSWNHQSFVNPPTEQHEPAVRGVYDASIRYLDEQIGNLIDILRRNRRYEDTYIVLLSDHGQALGEYNYWGHGTFLYHELLHVPLLIKTPAEKSSKVIETPVSLCNIPNFLLAQCRNDDGDGGRIGALIKGKDVTKEPVFAESHGPYEPEHLPEGAASSAGYRVMYYGPWRLHRNLESGNITIEQSPAASSKEVPSKEELLEIEDEYYTNRQVRKGNQQSSIPDSTKQRLKNLGYR